MPALAIPILLAIVLAAGLSARLGRAFVRSVMVGGLALGIPIVLLNGLILPGARDVLLPLERSPVVIALEVLHIHFIALDDVLWK